MKENKETIFIECECYSEGIMLEQWKDESEIYIRIWKRGIHPHKRGWIDRLKYIWHILRGKELHSDEIILNSEKASKIRDWLARSLQLIAKEQINTKRK